MRTRITGTLRVRTGGAPYVYWYPVRTRYPVLCLKWSTGWFGCEPENRCAKEPVRKSENRHRSIENRENWR
ncbi:hypothetical protein A2U01_0063196, partial [Trifolium medium]|nr:hypothetical protein [Trifolium medium]